MLTCYDSAYEIICGRLSRLLCSSISFSYFVLRRCWRAAKGLRRPDCLGSLCLFPTSKACIMRQGLTPWHLISQACLSTGSARKRFRDQRETTQDGREAVHFLGFVDFAQALWHTNAPFEHDRLPSKDRFVINWKPNGSKSYHRANTMYLARSGAGRSSPTLC